MSKSIYAVKAWSSFRSPKKNMATEVKVAISAKNTFVALVQMGYSYIDVSGN